MTNRRAVCLAISILEGELFAFLQWLQTFRVPLFQFDLLDANLPDVLQAARTDRSIAAG